MASHTYDSSSLLELDAGAIEKTGFISSVCFLDGHLFTGTTLGLTFGTYTCILAELLVGTLYPKFAIPPEKGHIPQNFEQVERWLRLVKLFLFEPRRRGHFSFSDAQVELSGSALTCFGLKQRKSVRKMHEVNGLNRIIVLSDSTGFLMDASTLECVPSSNAKLRNVADISVNDRIRTLQPFTAMQVACAHLKKPNISIYVITDSAFQLQQDLTVLSSPALTIHFSYPNACLATKDSYYLLRCDELVAEKQVLELFPVPGASADTPLNSKTPIQKPAIAAVWDAMSNGDTEFLLSGPGGLGMFIAGTSGDAQRPPINWAELNIQQLHYLTPYVFASTSNEIWIYSTHDQQPKQMIPFENAVAFCSAPISIVYAGGKSVTNRQRYRPVIASSRSVLALVPVPWQQQVSALMRDKRVVEALEAAQTYIEEDSEENPSVFFDESGSFNPKVYLQKLKRVGAFVLASSQLEFERAYSLLDEADVHPLDVIKTLAPDAIPNECRDFIAKTFTVAGAANEHSRTFSQLSAFDPGIGSEIPSSSNNESLQSASVLSIDSFGDYDFAVDIAEQQQQPAAFETTEKVRDFVVNFALAKRSQYITASVPSLQSYDDAVSTKLLRTAYDTAIVNLLAALSNSQSVFDTRQYYYYLQQRQRFSKQPTERDTDTPPPSGMSASADNDESASKRFRRRCRQQVVNYVGDHKWNISYSCCEVLKHYSCFHAAALLHLRNNDIAAALRTWRTCAEHKVDDASFAGLDQTVCAVLSDRQQVPSSEQLFTQMEWLMLLDNDAGVRVLKARVDVPPRDIVHFLSRFPLAQMHMLEYYVLGVADGDDEDENNDMSEIVRSDDEHLHTLLAVKYIQKCITLHNDAANSDSHHSSELEITKQKLRLLLKRSRALQPALLIDKLKAAAFLQRELVLLYAKMDEHERAMDLLVNHLNDYAGAVDYCVEQSSTFLRDNTSSSSSNSPFDDFSSSSNSARHAQQRQKRRMLFHLLLSRYFNRKTSDNAAADNQQTKEACRLLNDANAEFDAVAVLGGDENSDLVSPMVIPSSWPLVDFRGFLLQSLRQSLHGRRMAEMQCSLERSLLLHLREEVMQKRQHAVTLDESSRCCVCCHKLSSSSFARLPGDRLAHIGCCNTSRI